MAPWATQLQWQGCRLCLGSTTQTSSSQAALATAQGLSSAVAEVSTWRLVAPFPRDRSWLPGSRRLTLALSHHTGAMIHPPGIDAFWTEMWLGFLDHSFHQLRDSQTHKTPYLPSWFSKLHGFSDKDFVSQPRGCSGLGSRPWTSLVSPHAWSPGRDRPDGGAEWPREDSVVVPDGRRHPGRTRLSRLHGLPRGFGSETVTWVCFCHGKIHGSRDPPGGPVAKTLSSPRRRQGSIPGRGTRSCMPPLRTGAAR